MHPLALAERGCLVQRRAHQRMAEGDCGAGDPDQRSVLRGIECVGRKLERGCGAQHSGYLTRAVRSGDQQRGLRRGRKLLDPLTENIL
jgi:hypothetical protein